MEFLVFVLLICEKLMSKNSGVFSWVAVFGELLQHRHKFHFITRITKTKYFMFQRFLWLSVSLSFLPWEMFPSNENDCGGSNLSVM